MDVSREEIIKKKLAVVKSVMPECGTQAKAIVPRVDELIELLQVLVQERKVPRSVQIHREDAGKDCNHRSIMVMLF